MLRVLIVVSKRLTTDFASFDKGYTFPSLFISNNKPIDLQNFSKALKSNCFKAYETKLGFSPI